MKFRVGVPRNHPLALPVLVDDWIPADHLVRVIDRVVDALDLSEVDAKFHDQGPGAPAYPPKLLLKLLAYGYLTQRFSARRISLACHEDLAFLWITRLEHPQHSVISAFRQRHVDDLPEWLAQVVLLCIEEGMVGWKLGALDGTKIHADASQHQAMS
jgi:transposase